MIIGNCIVTLGKHAKLNMKAVVKPFDFIFKFEIGC